MIADAIIENPQFVERVDGTQARLKQKVSRVNETECKGGKGGWDSGEIETLSR